MELEIVPFNPLKARYLQEGREGGGVKRCGGAGGSVYALMHQVKQARQYLHANDFATVARDTTVLCGTGARVELVLAGHPPRAARAIEEGLICSTLGRRNAGAVTSARLSW
jgi:hypothetical protein